MWRGEGELFLLRLGYFNDKDMSYTRHATKFKSKEVCGNKQLLSLVVATIHSLPIHQLLKLSTSDLQLVLGLSSCLVSVV